jgi:hypothetical protein
MSAIIKDCQMPAHQQDPFRQDQILTGRRRTIPKGGNRGDRSSMVAVLRYYGDLNLPL